MVDRAPPSPGTGELLRQRGRERRDAVAITRSAYVKSVLLRMDDQFEELAPLFDTEDSSQP
jgi:hypothetical protein